MIKKLIKYILVLSYLAFLEIPSVQALSITAKLDSVNILMGNVTTLHLEIVENEGQTGRLGIFQQKDYARGFASVCGDSVEISTNYKVDTTRIGSGKLQLNFSIPVQSFDSGTYKLPKFIYYVGKDSVVSNSLSFNVYPVNVSKDEPIEGYDTVWAPDGARWYDWVPDWILDFWWIFLILLLAICISYYSLRNYKKGSLPFIMTKTPPKPWEVAISSLQRLKTRKLWEQGMEKEYYTELTDILRTYLYERFGINAMEMTSRQIMDKIYESDLKDKRDYVKQILNVADFVKFAKVRPLPADSIASYDNAVKFIEETIPEEENKESGKMETEKGGGEQK